MCEFLAAPFRFCVLLSASHAFDASAWHFFMKLVMAAPASFLSAACALQVWPGIAVVVAGAVAGTAALAAGAFVSALGAGVWAMAAVQMMATAPARMIRITRASRELLT